MNTTITPPTLNQLIAEFTAMKDSTFERINGVWHIDSGKPGPVLGITIHTHGNEPSGMAVLWYLRHQFKLQHHLLCGSVFFVLNNLRATEQYFAAITMTPEEKREQTKTAARFCNHNMNRLPSNALRLKSDKRYEIRRVQELRPIWERFEIAFDIHSTTKETQPMIIACGGLQPELIRGFPIDTIITNIERIQIGKPAVYFYGKRGKTRTIAIEAGSHESTASFHCAITCSLALLRNLKMLKGSNELSQREYREFFVNGSIVFPHLSFRLTKIFEMFESIRKSQVLAYGRGVEIVAKSNGHALMGPPRLRANSIKEEVFFLTRPARKIYI